MKKANTYKEVRKILRVNGWVEIRCNGSHHQFKHPEKGLVVTIPALRLSDTFSPGVLSSIEKSTGLSFRR